MFSLDNIQQIQQTIALFIAYVPSVTILGFFEAWMATMAGDETAEEQGFLTLNPLKHVDLFGLIFIVLIKWGFGQRIPTNPANIKSPYRNLKYFAVVFSKPFMSFILIIATFISWIVFKNSISADPSSAMIAIEWIISAFLRLNVTYFVIYTILGIANILTEFLLPDVYSRSLSVNIIVSVVFPIALYIALQPYIYLGLEMATKNIINLF